MSLENSKNNKLIISESNYSCEYFDEEYIKQKNNKSKKLYNLEEKEREIYDNQEELSKKMIKILSKNKNKFNSKFNRLKKQGEFYHYYYNNYNDKIKSLFNNHNNNYNNSILDLLSEFNKKWVFPENKSFLNNKTFQKKCDIKPCIKKNLKTEYNNSTKNKSKSFSKLIKTYRTNINNSVMINLKLQFNNKGINNKYKTERKSKYNSAVKISNIKPRKTAMTSLRNSNFSLFEENKALYMNSFFEDKNKKININTDKGLYSTKTSFRNYKKDNKDLILNINESKSFKNNFDTKYNFYKYNTNDKKFVIK